MGEPSEDFEQTVEMTVTPDPVATGQRRIFCLVLIGIGLFLVGVGALSSLPVAVRTVLALGGMGLVGAFGYVLIGATRVGGSTRSPGAEIPQGKTVITKWTQRGFPKKGRSPLEAPDDPPTGDSQD